MGFRNIIDNLPGLSRRANDDHLDALQEKIEKWRFVIQSMTEPEKGNPGIMNNSRRKRVARGSGMTEHDVKDLIKQYNNSKSLLKQAKGRYRRFGIG